MSRNLSVSVPRLPVFNKKLVFVSQSGYKFTVPSGVKEIYVTGSAAGGLGGQVSGAHTAYLNWAASGSRSPRLSASDNGAYILAVESNVSAAAIVAIDIESKRINRISSATGNGCFRALVANNGLAFLPDNSGATCPILGPGLQGPAAVSPVSNTGIRVSSTGPFASISPCAIDASQSSVRAVFSNPAGTAIYAYQGGENVSDKVVALLHTSSHNVSVTAIRNVNGRHVVLSYNGSATPKAQLFHIDDSTATDASVAANWSRSSPAGDSAAINLNDIAYGNNLYVVVGQNCKIYTSQSLDGPWTERASGIAASGQLYGVKFFAGKFVAAGSDGTNAVITTSSDGITWSATNSGLGTSPFYHYGIQYDYSSGNFIVTKPPNNGDYFYSSNGTSWALVAQQTVREAISTRLGCVFGHTTGIYLGSSILTDTGDGGDFSVSKNGVKVLTLAGGKQLTYGGASASVSYTPGAGSGGSGGLTTTVAPTGTGGVGANNFNGGGGSLQLTDLLSNSGSWGLKIPGASAGSAGTSGCGGGASILYGRHGGPGSGANSNGSYPGGGAGEGIVRFKVEVSEGDTLTVSTGLGGFNSVQNNRGADGLAILEWEAV